MTSGQRPYVAMPYFLKLSDQNLHYLDVLVYTSLRSFNNVVNKLCYPMHETIGKRAGLSKRFVNDSIKRLERSRKISVKRSEQKKVSNLYYFPENKDQSSEQKVPYELFDLEDLSPCEKAMLLLIRQFFNDLDYECHRLKPVKFFSTWLGLSENAIRKQFSALIAKGYIAERSVIHKRREKVRTYYRLTDKLNWNYEVYEKEAVLIDTQPLMVA